MTNASVELDSTLAPAAAAATTGRRQIGGAFSRTRGSAAERALGPLYGIFLSYSVARVQEVFPAIEVPRLPLIIGISCLLVLAINVKPAGWRLIWRESPIVQAMVGLLGLAIITIPIGIWPGGSFDYFQHKYIIQWLAFLIGAVLFRDRTILRRALVIYTLSVTAAAWVAVSGKANVAVDVDRVYIAGSLDPNDFGAILVTTIPIALWLASTTGAFRRLLWYAAALLMTAAIAPTASRGALLGIAAVALVLILIGTTGFKRLVMGGGIALGILVFSTVVSDEQMARFGSVGTSDDYNVSDGEGRIAIWKRGVWWTIKRPTGYGLDNFPIYFDWLNGSERAAHNSVVQIGMELGAAGVSLFLFIYFVGMRNGIRYLKRVRAALRRNRQLAAEASLVGFALASLAGSFMTGFFLSNAYAGITMLGFSLVSGTLLGAVDSGTLDALISSGLGATGTAGHHPPAARFPGAGRRHR